MEALMVFVLNATPAVSTPASPAKILLASTTTKQTWNALTPSAPVLGQEVKGDGFTDTVFSFIMGYSSNIWQTNLQKKKD